jgi:hypothetical protein
MLKTEDEIRDYLAGHLEVIQPGLQLYAKELYIPSKIATRSFIDLVALTPKRELVLIELKRSAAASREAIHEILKYVEAVKGHLAIREDEIRVIVASTDWSELLVPFSRLITDTSLAIIGIFLRLENEQITSLPVEPLQVAYGRILAPWGDVNYCDSREQIGNVIGQYEKRSKTMGMQDYIIVVLHSGMGRVSQHEATLRQTVTGIAPDEQIVDDPGALKPREILRYHDIVYFSAQLHPEETYWSILEKDSASIDRYRDETIEMEEDERLSYLHGHVWSSGDAIERSYLEIGYPAKLYTRLLSDEGWEIKDVLRSGSFKRNSLLTDETIIEELCGSEGHTGQRFVRDFEISNPAHVTSIRDGIARCLSENSIWKAHLLSILDEISEAYSAAELQLSIFNPATGLLTPYFFKNKPEGPLYLPSYALVVKLNQIPVRIYAGYLLPDHEPAALQEVLQTFYQGEIVNLMISFSWGGRTAHDEKLTDAYGCKYATFRRDLQEDPLNLYCLEKGRWTVCAAPNVINEYALHIAGHPQFFKTLFQLIRERDHGTWWEA